MPSEFPMHVGMNLTRTGTGRTPRGVPHARGDEPDPYAHTGVRPWSSPCTWG